MRRTHGGGGVAVADCYRGRILLFVGCIVESVFGVRDRLASCRSGAYWLWRVLNHNGAGGGKGLQLGADTNMGGGGCLHGCGGHIGHRGAIHPLGGPCKNQLALP